MLQGHVDLHVDITLSSNFSHVLHAIFSRPFFYDEISTIETTSRRLRYHALRCKGHGKNGGQASRECMERLPKHLASASSQSGSPASALR